MPRVFHCTAAASLLAVSTGAMGSGGDFIFADSFDTAAIVSPFQGTPAPTTLDLEFVPRVDAVDMYVILDRSGSMSAEITSVKNNLATVVNHLACYPRGTGSPTNCIADLWAGAGGVGYSGSGADAYRNFVDVQPTPNFAVLPTTEPGGCCSEPLNFSVYATITGNGGVAYGFTGVPARSTCMGSPAASAGYVAFGYPCFRRGALPLVLLATDEPPISIGDTNKTPNWAAVVKPAMLAARARFIGILGSSFQTGTDTDLRTMATDTRAVDSVNGNAPLVFNGADANAAAAIENGVRAALSGVPLDVNAVVVDDPNDAVDARAAFVDRIETLQLGTAECSNGWVEDDSDGDTYPDRYGNVRNRTALCWRLRLKSNVSVPASAAWQSFHATVRVVADGTFTLQERDVYFLVPPL